MVCGTREPPPPFMEKSILNFHFDCLHPSPMHSDVPGYRYDGDKENMNYWHPLFMSFKINEIRTIRVEQKYNHLRDNFGVISKLI